MSIAREIVDLKRRIAWLEGQLAKLPSRIGQAAGGSGGGLEYYERPSEASLPNDSSVGSKAFGRTTIDPPGGFFVRNETDDGWFCLTHWR